MSLTTLPLQPERRQPVDAEQRHRARTALDRCQCVEAAAGTGKTSLLLGRLVALLESGRAQPHQLAAVTFTELAAAELKGRLQDWAQEHRPDLVERLEEAQVSTIHALALAILRERPVEAGLPAGFEVLDPARSEELWDELWRAWLASEASQPSGAAVLRLALEVGLQPDQLRRVARQLYDQRDVVLEQAAARAGADPAGGETPALLQEVRSLQAELDELLGAGGPAGSASAGPDRLVDALAELRQQAVQLRQLWPQPEDHSPGGTASELSGLALALRWVRGLREQEALRRPGRLGSAARWRDPRALQALRRSLEALGRAVAAAEQRLGAAVAAVVGGWLCGSVAWVQREKRRRGLVDFLDQLLWCRDLLRDKPEVRRHFQRRWRYLLVDEFQDTDPLQAEILFFLAEASPQAARWDEVRLAPGKLFVVGDPKQSIYRFRRADIEVYERAARCLQEQGDRLTIRQNFRTLPAITDWVNRAFALLMPDGAPAGGGGQEAGGQQAGAWQARYVPLEPYRPQPLRPAGAATCPGPGVYLLRPPDLPDPAPVGEARRAEARQVARALHELVMSGRLEVWDEAGHGWRPAGPADCAVLMPAFTEVGVYEQALREAGVPFRVVGGRQFFLRDEVRELILLLLAVDTPCDGAAVLGSLRSAFFGVGDDALLRWVRAGGRLDALEPPPATACRAAPEVAQALASLARWHRETAGLAPLTALRRLLDETGYRAFVALRPDGPQALANLARLEAYAAGTAAGGWDSFHSFVRWLRRRGPQGAAAAEEEDAPVPAGDGAVRILTVHRAKGLEFPVVVVANLFQPRELAAPVVVDRGTGRVELRLGPQEAGLATAGYEEAVQAERERQRMEQVRLYYVAMTRARDYLIVSAPTLRQGFWGLLAEAARQQGAEVPLPPPLPCAGGPGPAASTPVLDQGMAQAAAAAQAPADLDGWASHRAALLQEASRGLEVRTAHARAHHPPGPAAGAGPGTPAEPVAPAADGLAEELARWDGTRAGAAFHLIMERAAARRLEVTETWLDRQLGAARRSLALSPQETEAVRGWVLLACGPASPLRALLQEASGWMAEAPFALASGGVLWEGRVDLVAHGSDGVVRLVDYKTDPLTAEGLVGRYGPQLAVYARAVQRIADRPVVACLYAARTGELVALPRPWPQVPLLEGGEPA